MDLQAFLILIGDMGAWRLKGELRMGETPLIGDLMAPRIGEQTLYSENFYIKRMLPFAYMLLLQQQKNIELKFSYYLHMDQQTTLPPFTLYNVSNDCSKACFQSENLTVLCNLVGPYFERNKITIDPIINFTLMGSTLTQQEIRSLGQKIKEIVNLTIVKDKYLRMNFDINYQIVEIKNQEEILPALINLLCFSLMLSGVEIKSIFSCSQIWLHGEKVQWSNKSKQPAKSDEVKKMCMALQSNQKQIIYSEFEGQFLFVHFQRLSNLLMDANEEIHTYIIKKVTEINDQFQN